jgi:hypothetical protein
MAAVPTSQRPTAKDDIIVYGAGYALFTVLSYSSNSTTCSSNTPLISSLKGSLGLLTACIVLLVITINSFGNTMLPDSHDKGTLLNFQIPVGKLVGVKKIQTKNLSRFPDISTTTCTKLDNFISHFLLTDVLADFLIVSLTGSLIVFLIVFLTGFLYVSCYVISTFP